MFHSKNTFITGKSTLVITLHEVWGDYWYTYLGKPGIFGKIIERAMLNLTDNIITVSERQRRILKQ